MKALTFLGVSLVGGVEILALLVHQRQLIMAMSGVALALLLFGLRRSMGEASAESISGRVDSDERGEFLRRWLSSTETLVHWSESTRTDWDRHWRPILAQRFEASTGHRRAKDRATFDATGRMLFGTKLWQWVDPSNVAESGGQEPGPGRVALEEILQRLEER
ncbi:MAG TPA: hypothetical protein VF299_11080 [Mycobacterium sp.]